MSLLGFLSFRDEKGCQTFKLLGYLLTALNSRVAAYYSSATGVWVGRHSENICFVLAVSAFLLYKEPMKIKPVR